MSSTSRNLCSLYFHPFFPASHESQKFSIYLSTSVFAPVLLESLDFVPFLHFQCVPLHCLLITYTSFLNITGLWYSSPTLCSNTLLREHSGSGFFSSSFSSHGPFLFSLHTFLQYPFPKFQLYFLGERIYLNLHL